MTVKRRIANQLLGCLHCTLTRPTRMQLLFPGVSLIGAFDYVNPLRSNIDQRQISLCNINAFSAREVMRIKEMITQREFRQEIKFVTQYRTENSIELMTYSELSGMTQFELQFTTEAKTKKKLLCECNLCSWAPYVLAIFCGKIRCS